jgi:hypothetical protein
MQHDQCVEIGEWRDEIQKFLTKIACKKKSRENKQKQKVIFWPRKVVVLREKRRLIRRYISNNKKKRVKKENNSKPRGSSRSHKKDEVDNFCYFLGIFHFGSL